MKAYIYNADIACEQCASEIKESLQCDDTGDSDDYPQYAGDDGGGEADSPQHCGWCGDFMENPLTDLGREYVNETVIQHVFNPEIDAGLKVVFDTPLSLWVSHYNIEYPEYSHGKTEVTK